MKTAAVICLTILLLTVVSTNAQYYMPYGYYPPYGGGFGGPGIGRGLSLLGGAALLTGGGSPFVRAIGGIGVLGGLGFI